MSDTIIPTIEESATRSSQDARREGGLVTPTKTGGRTAETLVRHVEAFTRGDLDALMSDYCDDAVLIAQDGVYRSSREIKAFSSKSS